MNDKVRKIIENKEPELIVLTRSNMISMKWMDDNYILHRKIPFGISYEERLVKAVNEFKDMQFKHVNLLYK